MRARTILLTVMCSVVLRSTSFAEEIQKHADAMIQRAREFSDIRSQGAPAFRLRATFSFVGEDLATIQGTFNEVWISNCNGAGRRWPMISAALKSAGPADFGSWMKARLFRCRRYEFPA